MSSEFKPGDVAIVSVVCNGLVETGPCLAFWDSFNEEWVSADIGRLYPGLDDNLVVRPLVVIDPEDAEQVERLAHPLWEELETLGSRDFHALVPRVQAALREFARPTPRIEEPTGLGAVVEDDEGTLWIRTSWTGEEHYNKPWQDGAAHRHWQIVDAVRILSPGVTP